MGRGRRQASQSASTQQNSGGQSEGTLAHGGLLNIAFTVVNAVVRVSRLQTEQIGKHGKDVQDRQILVTVTCTLLPVVSYGLMLN
jgi:hypothetical protein